MRAARGPRGAGGMALLLTLLAAAILTGLCVEFAYGVYTNTEFLYNWQAAGGLSRSARSGVSLAAYLLEMETRGLSYTYPARVTSPPVDPFGDGTSTVYFEVEDEDSKFPLNALVYENGEINQAMYEGLERLLDHLFEGEDRAGLAARIADWIDPDQVPLGGGWEEGVRNGPLASTDELIHVPGVTREIYDKLMPYVSAHGSGLVNINGAEPAVLLALSEDMTLELAERMVTARVAAPFERTSALQQVPGFETLGIELIGSISVKGTRFMVRSRAETPDGVGVTIECVMDLSGMVYYWREI